MPNWEEIQKEWETTKITLAALAGKYDVALGTLKSRKSRDKNDGNEWLRGSPKKDATKSQKDATPAKRMQPKKERFEPVVESNDLNDKQRLFCIYYIKYFNATKAYQKAYGCAYTTARVEGSRHLANPNISHEIDRMKAEQSHGLKLDVQDIIQKYIDIAFADITDFSTFDEDKQLMQIKSFDEIDGTIISEISETQFGMKVKLADRMKAMEALEKYVGFMSEEQKARVDLLKSKVSNQDKSDINKQVIALADLINNPAPDRVIDDD